jgi:hypothetical protein
MSRDDAAAIVDRWQAKIAETRQQAEQKAREVGDAAARGLSKAALWSFVAMLLGAVAAALGGLHGTASLTGGPMLPRRGVVAQRHAMQS